MPGACETGPQNTERRIQLLRYPGLRVDARVRGVRVVGVEAHGPLSRLMRPTLQLMEEYVVREKPAAVGEDFVVTSLFFPPIPSPEFSRALRNQIRVKLTRRPLPEVLSISVTEACGANCWLCGHYGRKKAPEMDTGEVKALVDAATSMGCFNVTWTGGDPVLRRDLAELTRYTRSRGAINTMFTPGTVLAGRARELAKAGLYSVYVLLHSPDAREHDRLVGDPGAHRRATGAIRACLAEGIYTGAATYADAQRLRDGSVENLIAYAERLGCHEILLSDPLPTGKVLRREDIILTRRDRDALVRLQKQHNTRRSGGIKVFTNSCVKGPEGVGCIAARKWVHVTAVGEVSPCDYTPLSFGNVRREPFQGIWRRMARHPVYRTPTGLCRIQDPDFRRRFVDAIPQDANLPYPVDGL